MKYSQKFAASRFLTQSAWGSWQSFGAAKWRQLLQLRKKTPQLGQVSERDNWGPEGRSGSVVEHL